MRSATAVGALLAIALSAARALGGVLPDGGCAGVYWDITAAFASGDRVYARVLVTRAGPGARSAAGLGYWLEPGGVQTRFQNGRGEGDFEFAVSGDRIRIGSTRLDLGGADPAFEVDNDKRGVKLRLALGAAPLPAPVSVFDGDPEVDLIALARPTTARAWHDGMAAPRELSGNATIVRTRHRACEADLSAMRVDVHGLGANGPSLLIHERLTDGTQRSWLAWQSARTELVTARPDAVSLEDWSAADGGTPLPRRLRPVGSGLTGVVAIGAAQLAVDPLDALPRLLRMLYWFGERPRRIWADATSELASGGSSALPRGSAIASFSFLRPPEGPSQTRSRDPGG
ncbi:MAG TPA: hypothetical protein VKH41_03230 [Myxococcota bacterium]|nr:hypothetical protein [Myxococcota bacterium]